MSWTIHTSWATNTDSRYAFYQTFWIAADSSQTGVGIVHYGKLNGTSEKTSRRPVDGGNFRMFGRCGQGLVNLKLSEKTSKDCKLEDRKEVTIHNEQELRDWLTETMGASRRDEILPMLFLPTGPHAGPATPADDTPDEPAIAPPMTEIDDSFIDNDMRGAW